MLTQTDLLDALTQAVKDVETSRYLAVSALTLCLYDWMLVFADELELVGSTRLCLGKVLYYTSRIITPFGLIFALYQLLDLFRGNLSHNFCIIFTFICPLMEVMSILASYWLLMLRLVALYKKKPWVVRMLYASLFASYFVTLGLLLRAQVFFVDTLVYTPSIGICATTQRASTLWGIFLAPFGVEVLLFGLTMYHAWKEYRSQSDSSALPLLRVMYRDGIFAFSIMIGLRMWNVFIYASQPLTRTYMGIYIMWAAISLLASRTYLNLVHVARHQMQNQTSITSHVSYVSFRSPKVIGRPLPVKTMPNANVRGPMESEIFYSGYFQDEFAFEPITLDAMSTAVAPAQVIVQDEALPTHLV